jgi:hypothetical protein
MTRNLFRWLNIVAFAGVLAVNYLANALPLGGKTSAEISDAHPTLVTPAGYVFAIWGLIYLLTAGFVIYQALPAGQRSRLVPHTDGWFLLSCLGNISWLFLWHYEYIPYSLIAMAVLLLSLIMLYTGIQREAKWPTLTERILVLLPFSVYLGWICVATIVNVSVVLKDAQIPLFQTGEALWAAAVLAVAVILALVTGGRNRDYALMLVFIWAFLGIAVEQKDNGTVLIAALLAAIVVAVYALWLSMTASRKRQIRR